MKKTFFIQGLDLSWWEKFKYKSNIQFTRSVFKNVILWRIFFYYSTEKNEKNSNFVENESEWTKILLRTLFLGIDA